MKRNRMKQGKDQSIEAFVAELKLIIEECQYGEGEQHIIDALIFGSNNTRVQAKLLEDTDPNLTLQKAIEKAKSIEATQRQLSGITGIIRTDEERVNSIKHQGQRCSYCGTFHKRGECPAYGGICKKCHKKNHWANVCISKETEDRDKKKRNRSEYKKTKINCVKEKTSTDENTETMYYYSVDSQLNSTESTCRPNIKESNRKQLLIKLPIFSKHARRDIQFKIDSGAFGNLLPIGVYRKLYPKEKLDKFGHPSGLHRENVKLVAYNGSQIEQYGKCLLTVKNRNKNLETFFHIVPSEVPILGLPTSEALGLIAVNCSILWELRLR
ncbi:hypothetical protein SNE40_013581 [Patella caerulea]|uniref:Uncharacterized protein n=1 Tax=Patella caerulea TaxID=87958 RepID=A0AAN8JGF0_PATCE